MKNTTQDMSQTTSGMAKTTESVKIGMDESNAHQAAVQADLDFATYATRQGATADLRQKMLTDMKADKTLAGKIKDASVLCMAFEFQIWTPEVADADYRNSLFTQAIEELVETILSLRKSNSVDATGISQNMYNLYALAATLHRINPLQDEFASNADQPFNEYSLLNIISDGLRQLDDANKNNVNIHNLPAYIQRVQQYSEPLLYILKVRYNFLAAFAWNELQDGPPMTTLDQLGKILTRLTPVDQKKDGFDQLVGKIEGKIENWEPHWANLPAAQVDRAAEILEYANATKNILNLIGKPLTDKDKDPLIKNQYATLQWGDALNDSVKTSDCNNYIARTRLKAAMDQYLDNVPMTLPPTDLQGWSGSTTPDAGAVNSCGGSTTAQLTNTFSSGNFLN